jgi:hypothetical protein
METHFSYNPPVKNTFTPRYGNICKSEKMADFPIRNGCVGRNGWMGMYIEMDG